MNKPFKQGRFEDLPEKPFKPHLFFKAEQIDLSLAAPGFKGMKVHVRKYGKGEPLFLIHGFMITSYSWRYAFKYLGEKFTCYAVDLPGAGRTETRLDFSYEPAVLAQWLIEVLRALNIYGCKTIGNSMGGYLAMHMALADQNCMSKLINLHSPGLAEFRFDALNVALGIPGSRALLKYIFQRDTLRFVHKNVHYYDESLKSLEEAREYAATLMTEDGAEAFIKYFAETMNVKHMRALAKTLQALEKFAIPLLLLYAEEDPMVPPKVGRELKKLAPSAELVYLKEGSHFAHVDRPELFADHAMAFLSA